MIQTVKDLLVRELNEVYSAEQAILNVLPQLAGDCQTQEAKDLFLGHAGQTQQQLENIRRCFQILGSRPRAVPSEEIKGLAQALDAFTREEPSPELLALFDLDKALKAKHYEIASYRMLIDMSNLLAHGECARLLEQNLNQEEEMARRLQQMGRLMAQQSLRRAGESWRASASG